jgi:hypothetical protein
MYELEVRKQASFAPATAPGMAIPKPEHQNIPTQRDNYNDSQRDLAKDAKSFKGTEFRDPQARETDQGHFFLKEL